MATRGPVGVGLIGAGMISDTYLENLTSFPDLSVLVLGDLDVGLAEAQAEKHGVPQWGTGADVLAHPDVELVVNLTIPRAHAEVSGRAVGAGKHVWSEKPISIDRASGRELLAQAKAAGVLVGVAPDTVLGPGVQTALRVIARGDIGEPLSAQTVMQYAGPDVFHPNPEFLFARGAGPVFDMGPYYLTTLAHVFGPVRSVAAVASTRHTTRTVKVGDRAGTVFDVEVPTHVSTIAGYVDGGVSQSVFSFDSPINRTGIVEVYGTEGTLVIPDPNTFTGIVRITRDPVTTATSAASDEPEEPEEPDWEDVPVTGTYATRGLGVLDLARAARTGRQLLASGELAYHVLDTMVAIDAAVTEGRTVAVESRFTKVSPVAEDYDPFAATL